MNVQEAVGVAVGFYNEGQIDLASQAFDQILCQIDKPDPNVYICYGSTLIKQHKYGLGIMLLEQGIRLYDSHPLAWCNLGVAYKHIGRDELALAAYEKAYELDANMPEVLAGLAGYWIDRDAPQSVEDLCRRALALNPDLDAAKMHLGMGLLAQGRFEEGWPWYEYRWTAGDKCIAKRPYKAPMWDGQPVDVLAIHGEQGLGDEIMFMSLFREAQKRARSIVIECAERLVPIFRDNFGPHCYPSHAELIKAQGEPDAYIPMGSLPRLLGFPDGKPYLKRPVHFHGGKPRIGIAWRGGTQQTGYHNRTLSLDQLAPVFNAVDATFVSVQYGGKDVDIEAGRYGLTVGERDFDTLQRRIGSCDLVISVCQTALHQAGAMGVPTLVMVPRKAPWVVCGETMPWYESVKLIRQTKDGDWSDVIDKVVAELKERFVAKAA